MSDIHVLEELERAGNALIRELDWITRARLKKQCRRWREAVKWSRSRRTPYAPR